MNETVKTKILIISDTHCAPLTEREGAKTPVAPFKAPLPAADLLLHCGDLTHYGRQEQYHEALDMLKEIDAPVKLVIAGSHDASLDEEFILGHLHKPGHPQSWKHSDDEKAALLKVKQARDLWLAPDGRARMEGVNFLEEGVHSIDLPNGARVNIYASPYTPEFCDFAFPYKKDEDRFNPPSMSLPNAKNIATNPVPLFPPLQPPIDILMTHGPPYGHLDDTKRGEAVGCPHLLLALKRSKPLIHCFGHIHEGWGAERISWSRDVDKTTTSPLSLPRWMKNIWNARKRLGSQNLERIVVDEADVHANRAAVVNLSEAGGKGLKRGYETFLVNSAIMDVRYQPVNAPWLIELDLPKAN